MLRTYTYDILGRPTARQGRVVSDTFAHNSRTAHPALWYITWDPSQPIATRPLAIQINGTWYTYGIVLTKNICELYSPSGTISTTYTYSPFGQVTASGSVTQSPRGLGGGEASLPRRGEQATGCLRVNLSSGVARCGMENWDRCIIIGGIMISIWHVGEVVIV